MWNTAHNEKLMNHLTLLKHEKNSVVSMLNQQLIHLLHFNATHDQNMNMNQVYSGNVYSLLEASHPGMTFPHRVSVVLEKPDPCTCRCHWTVNIQTRENSHSTLIKWKNQPACFGLHSTSCMFFFFNFPKKTYNWSDRFNLL